MNSSRGGGRGFRNRGNSTAAAGSMGSNEISFITIMGLLVFIPFLECCRKSRELKAADEA